MAKMKTHRASAKRFKRTGTGKIKRFKAYKSHLTSKKSPKRIRKLKKINSYQQWRSKKNQSYDSLIMEVKSNGKNKT